MLQRGGGRQGIGAGRRGKAGSAGGAADPPVHQQDAGDEEGDTNAEHVRQRHVVREQGGCKGAHAAVGAGGAGVIKCDVAVVAVVQQRVSEVALWGSARWGPR